MYDAVGDDADAAEVTASALVKMDRRTILRPTRPTRPPPPSTMKPSRDNDADADAVAHAAQRPGLTQKLDLTRPPKHSRAALT